MKTLFILTVLFFSTASFAQGQLSDTLSQKCREEVEKLCPSVPSMRERVRCLRSVEKTFSVDCKQELQRFTLLNRQAFNRAGGSMSALGGMNVFGPAIPTFNYEGRYISPPQAESMTENRFNVQMPVYQGAQDRLGLALSASKLHINDSIKLSTGKKVPRDLNRVETGFNYFKNLEGQRGFGVRGSVGYAGDKIFEAGNNFAYSVMANYAFPGSSKSTWAVTAFMTNNSFFAANVPIPGFMYIYRTETFTGLFGLPIASMQWTPSFPWSYTLSIFGPIINGEVAYGSVDEYQLFAGASWSRQVFMLSDREKTNDRLTLEEKKLQVGVRTPFFWKILSEISVGQAFDRSFYIGQGFSQKDDGQAHLKAGAFMSWNFRLAF